ncbi:MAG: hypothetical protein HC892_09895 [Saprospiraceae bacterium]|nr:hypothetical protein [Saprospiraceae bacterium]
MSKSVGNKPYKVDVVGIIRKKMHLPGEVCVGTGDKSMCEYWREGRDTEVSRSHSSRAKPK